MGRKRGRRRNRRRSRRGPSRSRRNTRRTTRRTRTRTRRAAPKAKKRAAPKRKIRKISAKKFSKKNVTRKTAKKTAPKRRKIRKISAKKFDSRRKVTPKKTVTQQKKKVTPKKTIKKISAKKFDSRKVTPKKTVTPKSRDQRMRDAARKRNENFKKTRVQTFGGTRKNYSAAEARKIEKAGLNFSKVTGGAKNPIARPPANPNIKPGELMPSITAFNESLGTDYSNLAGSLKGNPFAARPDSSISFSDAAKAGSRLGINRSNDFKSSPKVNYNFNNRDKSAFNYRDMFQAKDLGNMTTNAINTIVDKIPIIGEKIPNIRPMSMTDRDRQQYLGFNRNASGSYLKQQERNMGGSGYSQAQQQQVIEPEPEPVENTTVEEANPLADLTSIQQDAYNTALENYNAGTGYSGQGEGAGFGGLSQAVIAALMAGNRGQKRFRYGTAKKRGSDSLLTRGSERFKGFTTTGQLNI